MVGHGGSSAGLYIADPTSPIPSHCASIVATSTLRVKTLYTVSCLNLPVGFMTFTILGAPHYVDHMKLPSSISKMHRYVDCFPTHNTTKTVTEMSYSFSAPLRNDKMTMSTHTYLHKPLRKIKVTICNHQADSPLYVRPDV